MDLVLSSQQLGGSDENQRRRSVDRNMMADIPSPLTKEQVPCPFPNHPRGLMWGWQLSQLRTPALRTPLGAALQPTTAIISQGRGEQGRSTRVQAISRRPGINAALQIKAAAWQVTCSGRASSNTILKGPGASAAAIPPSGGCSKLPGSLAAAAAAAC